MGKEREGDLVVSPCHRGGKNRYSVGKDALESKKNCRGAQL